VYENLNAQLEAWRHQRFNDIYREAIQASQTRRLEATTRKRVAIGRSWSQKLAYYVGQELIAIGARLQQLGTYHPEHVELR
jgi:hypothetical protein